MNFERLLCLAAGVLAACGPDTMANSTPGSGQSHPNALAAPTKIIPLPTETPDPTVIKSSPDSLELSKFVFTFEVCAIDGRPDGNCGESSQPIAGMELEVNINCEKGEEVELSQISVTTSEDGKTPPYETECTSVDYSVFVYNSLSHNGILYNCFQSPSQPYITNLFLRTITIYRPIQYGQCSSQIEARAPLTNIP